MYRAILIIPDINGIKKPWMSEHDYQSIETIKDMGLERDEDARIIPGTSKYRGRRTKNTQGHSQTSPRDHQES